jgi:hypothetical protein
MIIRSPASKEMPLKIVGSSTFGRYPKISSEKTYNMFESDGWLVPYSGYEKVRQHPLGLEGRGIFYSSILDDMIAVFDAIVYRLNVVYTPSSTNPFSFNPVKVGTLDTDVGDVYITENNGGQVAISDNINIYIYSANGATPFQKATLDFIPGYITFHDTRFLCAVRSDPTRGNATNTWRLSDFNNGLSWPNDAAHVGLLQTKPDNVVAVVRFPSRGNMIFVMGATVTEPWFDVGYQLFPYQRNTSFNIDYGCVSPATIASMDEVVVWLGKNEKSGPVILVSDGGPPEKISTDGIDYLLSNIDAPADSEAFIYRQDGHLFYHINFYTDNFSLYYDFNTKQFYNASDENMNYFIAKDVAFYNNQYYFVSRNNGFLYAFDTIYTTYDGEEIPRIRTCNTIRFQDYFRVTDLGFTIEQGVTNYDYQVNGTPILPRVDLSISTDGGESFGNYISQTLNPIGKKINKLQWWQLGMANDFTPQFRFWGMGRFVVNNGIVNITS